MVIEYVLPDGPEPSLAHGPRGPWPEARPFGRAASSRPSSVIDVSRILNFCTLPVTVIGKSSVNRT